MRILFYFPTNKSSVSLETLMISFQAQGHQVYLLGWDEKGAIHANVAPYGVITHVYNPKRQSAFMYYLRHIFYLAGFIRKEHIDLVYSHTQPVNFVAAFAQYFVSAKVYLCRHHSDSMVITQNRNGRFFDNVINRLGKSFIVPSLKVMEQMRIHDGVKGKEIRLIRYAYDFSKYAQPDSSTVANIRKDYPAQLLIVKVARLISNKRHSLLFDQIKKLVNEGLDIKLLVLSEGPLESQLRARIQELKLDRHVFFIGYTTQVIDYLAASDVVVHLSDSEASNSLIKEAGLLEKIVAVCADVGDFDEYIEHEVNGFTMPKANPSDALYSILKAVYSNKHGYDYLGTALKRQVLERFSVDNVIDQYIELK